MPTTPLAVLGLGFLLGVRHSLDIDHLAAVTTIVSQRRSLFGSAFVGALWGLGHTASLFVVAVAVIGLRTEIPPGVARLFELGVAAMLVGLGVNLLRKLWLGGSLHYHSHDHGDHHHAHPHLHVAGHAHDPGHHHEVRVSRRPFFVGLVHGLAGSAALMLAVLTTIPDRALALWYVAVFGVGSIGGMITMSTFLGAPMAFVAGRFARAERAFSVLAGLGSVTVGVIVAWEIAVDAGLLA